MNNDEEKHRDWLNRAFEQRGISELPSRLFKFVSTETKYFPLAMHELLLHSRIYLSSRRQFNDPFDSRIAFDEPDTDQAKAFATAIAVRHNVALEPAYIAGIEQNLPDFLEKTRNQVDESLDSAGIYSLSDNIRHPLLWAHYACSHRGIALIFKNGVEGVNFGGIPVIYEEDFPRVSFTRDGIDVMQTLVKGDAWRYEGEYRLLEARKALTWMEIDSNALSGVVLGARCAPETLEFLGDLAERRSAAGMPGLQLFKASTSEKFELDFHLYHGKDQWVAAEPR